jgi:uncharacterized RDD family membrane protein YckC
MNWYYVDAGQQAGPVEESQLEELQRNGKIQRDTLVWHEGMANWQPYHEVSAAGLGVAGGAPPVATATLDTGVCAECGGVFNLQDMIAYGGIHVCATCKPVFMQKLAEGARLSPSAMTYATFWTRFAAVFLDGLIMWVFSFALQMATLSFRVTPGPPSPGMFILPFVIFFVQIAVALSYEVVMVGKYGATLGKMACKIKVVTADGGKVSYLRALGRYFAKMLSGMICLVGYIMAGFDEEKRALHDRICDTRVVLK